MTHTIKVYDYANHAVDIDIPNKVITSIDIVVISGDEAGMIYFADGTSMSFDSSTNRLQDYLDRRYRVVGKQIEKWINFIPTPGLTVSYERASVFANDDEGPSLETCVVTEDMYCTQPFLSQAGQWICTEENNYVFFDKVTNKVWRVTEITNEVVFEEGDKDE